MTERAEILRQLEELADPDIAAAHSQRFFKTGPGEYGEGDTFVGIRVPVLRRIAKQHRDAAFADIESFVQSPIHEYRLLGLLLLVGRFERGDDATRKAVFESYCRNMRFVNNWDLVDCSAHRIVGPYLENRSRRRLFDWAKSDDIWKRRIAMMATYAFIKKDEFADTLEIAELLLLDEHDLIHKIVGWMLREIGNRDRRTEEEFLKRHYTSMPRTMLRYAIEKFPERLRKRYLKGTI